MYVNKIAEDAPDKNGLDTFPPFTATIARSEKKSGSILGDLIGSPETPSIVIIGYIVSFLLIIGTVVGGITTGAIG